jgi:hypothetical protein
MNRTERGAWTLVVFAVGALAVAGCRGDEAANQNAPALQQRAPVAPPQASEVPRPDSIPLSAVPTGYTGQLAPLPISPYAAPRPPEVIRAVYTFAARHPEVLHYVPCFCGCQHSGHSGNDDCFIKGREPNGRPVWDPHGMT